jgi:uncharacterized membrane protein required for colicin V production
MEIVSLAALFLGLFISYKFSDLIALWITGTTLAKPISFSLCFILTIVLVNLLGRILKRVLKPVLSEFLDKVLGILFGILKVVLVAGVLFYFIDTVAYSRRVNAVGDLFNGYVDVAYGVRPAVSLTPGIEYSDGDGSMANPYKVELGS